MRIQIVVNACKPRQVIVYDSLKHIPKKMRPRNIENPPWGALCPWLGARPFSNELVTFSRCPITPKTIAQITNGLKHQDSEKAIGVACALAEEFGFLGFELLSDDIKGEPFAVWTALSVLVNCIIRLREKMRNFDKMAVVNELDTILHLGSTYNKIGFPLIRRPEIKDPQSGTELSLDMVLYEPERFTDAHVLAVGQYKLIQLARELGRMHHSRSIERGLHPVITQNKEGESWVLLEAESLLSGLSAYLLYSISADLNTKTESPVMGLPRPCVNEACQLVFTPTRTNDKYAGPNSSCRVERGRGKPCKWAREQLGLA